MSLRKKAVRWIAMLRSPIQSQITAGEWFERVAGTICGAGQKTFVINNAYKPKDRALSVWLADHQDAKNILCLASLAIDQAVYNWDNVLTSENTAAEQTFPCSAAYMFLGRLVSDEGEFIHPYKRGAPRCDPR